MMTMTPEQRANLELIFEDLDNAVAELRDEYMESIPGISDALEVVNDARNTIHGLLQTV